MQIPIDQDLIFALWIDLHMKILFSKSLSLRDLAICHQTRQNTPEGYSFLQTPWLRVAIYVKVESFSYTQDDSIFIDIDRSNHQLRVFLGVYLEILR